MLLKPVLQYHEHLNITHLQLVDGLKSHKNYLQYRHIINFLRYLNSHSFICFKDLLELVPSRKTNRNLWMCRRPVSI